MKEQSHKDEMSAALRGDFARLRARGVAAMLGAAARGAGSTADPTPQPPVTAQPGKGRMGLPRFRRRD